MAITFPEPPPGATEALRRAVAALYAAPDGVSLLQMTSSADSVWAEPHLVYHLGLDAIRAKRGVAAARPVSWRYLRDAPGGATLAADVDAEMGEHRFSGLHQGPFVHGFAAAVKDASADPVLRRSAFEARLLQAPAAYVVALWLHQPASVADIFIPLSPVNSALEAGRRYSRADFEAALIKATENVHRAPANDRGEPGTEAP